MVWTGFLPFLYPNSSQYPITSISGSLFPFSPSFYLQVSSLTAAWHQQFRAGEFLNFSGENGRRP